MRARIMELTAIVAVGLIVAAPSQAQVGVNLLPNGGFETGQIAPFGTYGTCTTEVVTDCVGATVPEKPVEGKYCLHVVVPAAGANNWDVGMTDNTFTFKQGKKYTFACFIKTKKGTLDFRMKPEHATGGYEAYNELVATATDKWQEFYTTTPVMTADVTPASPTFHFAFAPGDFWVDGIRFYEGEYVKPAFQKMLSADEPSPQDKATDVPMDTLLKWKAGPYAQTHNVYFGTAFADVNNAAAGTLVSAGQAEATYKLSAPLEYGKTYYWRVDEVNAPPSSTIVKGSVWSFTAEPYTYAIPSASITATASSQDKATTGPANTINGSGLANDLHSTSSDAMWASSALGGKPAWIQYQFDKAYKLSEMWVWNYNSEFEVILGYGLKDVTIEYSLDGNTWTLLKDMQFAQAPAAAGYAHNTTVDCGGTIAQYVRLTAKSNWSAYGINQFGLSEVRFYYLPVQARSPQPASGAMGVALDASVDWRPGRDAASEKVYFAADKQGVSDGTVAAQTVTAHGYAPGALDFGTTYYWKVDEVGAATTYPGSLWSFTTQEFAAVDDFESYSDKPEALLYEAWIDGLTDGLSGSTVGYLTPVNGTFGETVIVHGGGQSMPLTYDNSKAPYCSEVARTFDDPQNWTGSGADSLMLYFQGYPALTTVAVTETAGKISVTGAGTDIWGTSDQFTFVYKTLEGDGTIVARVVDKGTGTNVWAKGGVMIRDDLGGGSTFTAMVLADNKDGTASNGYSLQYRLMADNSAASTDGIAPEVKAPYWVKIQRSGDGLAGFISADGKTWKQHGSTQMITMTAPVYVGLCVTSHQAGENRTFQFDNISTTGNVTGNWQGAVIAGSKYNAPAGLYVTVQDKAGKKKTVANPDPAAANAAAWTAWKIALSDFTGVNMAAVKTLTIGIGDPVSPKAGGAGIVFFDDIGFGKQAVVDTTNLAVNGGFETGAIAPWAVNSAVTSAVVTDCAGAALAEGPIEGKYCLNVKVPGPGTNFWDYSFNQAGPTFQKGHKYTMSAFFKCKSGTGKINMKPEHAADPWDGYGETQVTITDKWAEYHVTTPVFTADVSPTSLTFHIAFQAQEFWVDNVKFYEGDYIPTK